MTNVPILYHNNLQLRIGPEGGDKPSADQST